MWTSVTLSSHASGGDWTSTFNRLFVHSGIINVKLISTNVNGVASYSEIVALEKIVTALRVPANSLRARGKQYFNDRRRGN